MSDIISGILARFKKPEQTTEKATQEVDKTEGGKDCCASTDGTKRSAGGSSRHGCC